MKNKQILDSIGEVDEKYIAEASPNNQTVKVQKPIWIKWGAISACLALLVLSATLLPRFLDNNAVPPIEQKTPAADSPNGMRKYMNYNHYRYAFLENGATYHFSPDQLVTALGILEHDIQKDPETNAKKDLAASFALGGTVYQLSAYDVAFRLAVEWKGDYYICEKVDAVDDTNIDVAEYFKLAGFPEGIQEIVINDHIGATALKTLPDNTISPFIDSLTKVVPAKLTSDDYAKIGTAQKSGESYRLSFQLKDSTQYKIYIIPTLSLAMIGDNKYTLSNEFIAEFGSLFDGLVQQPMPLQ